MKLRLTALAVLLCTSQMVMGEQTILLKIQGIKDADLNTNVRIYLSQLDNSDADGSEQYQQRVQDTVDKALRAKGYYNSQYQFRLEPKAKGKDWLILNVTLDKPVKLNEREVVLRGQAEHDTDFQALLDKSIPQKGDILNHGTYDDFKSSLEKLAQSKGYFDGQWLAHRLEVYPREHIADWRLAYASGERYRYGKISFKGGQIREDYLQNMLRIKSGEEYLLTDLSKLSSDFSGSNWFSSVLVEPTINEADKNVDLNVLLHAKKRNDVEVGVGFATDVGPRLQLNWKKPWINDRGHSIESNTYISKPEQRFEFGYKMPIKENPLNYYYEISGGVEREKLNDTKVTGANLAFQRFWNHETGWAFSLGIKARYDSFVQADDRFKTFLLYPTASINRLRNDGNRFPLWGDSQKLTLNWGSKLWGSDVNFYSAKLSSAWVRTYFDNHRFYLRGEVGYLSTTEFERITPTLRYFAGGDMSVRGFGYKDLSPRDTVTNKYTGGSHLVTATAEYQYQVYPNWWAATFYDTGFAAKRYSKAELHSGAGIGVRWASPIGAIKFDLATPVRNPGHHKRGIQFYIGLGTDL